MGKMFDVLGMLGLGKKEEFSDVLAWVNDVRGQIGLEPINELPRGTPKSSTGCVIARALTIPGRVAVREIQLFCDNSTFRAVEIYTLGGETLIPEPLYVAEFVNRFDTGKIQELIAA